MWDLKAHYLAARNPAQPSMVRLGEGLALFLEALLFAGFYLVGLPMIALFLFIFGPVKQMQELGRPEYTVWAAVLLIPLIGLAYRVGHRSLSQPHRCWIAQGMSIGACVLLLNGWFFECIALMLAVGYGRILHDAGLSRLQRPISVMLVMLFIGRAGHLLQKPYQWVAFFLMVLIVSEIVDQQSGE
jgi:hypothetical protein